MQAKKATNRQHPRFYFNTPRPFVPLGNSKTNNKLYHYAKLPSPIISTFVIAFSSYF